MPFCTVVEWDEDFDISFLQELNERAGVPDGLPDGCLSRIVGAVDTGARVIVEWESPDHEIQRGARPGQR